MPTTRVSGSIYQRIIKPKPGLSTLNDVIKKVLCDSILLEGLIEAERRARPIDNTKTSEKGSGQTCQIVPENEELE